MKYLQYTISLIGLCMCSIVNAGERLIIKYKPTQTQTQMLKSGTMSQIQLNRQLMTPLSTSAINKLQTTIGKGFMVKEINQVGTGAHVIEVTPSGTNTNKLSASSINYIINKLKADPNVEYVEVDRLLKQMSVESYNPLQWDMLYAPNQTPSGDNFQNLKTWWANNISPTNPQGYGVTVAVLDTGYTPHPNFLSNLVPYTGSCTSQNGESTTCYGYTFISNCSSSHIPNSTVSPYESCVNGIYYPDGLDWGDWTTSPNKSSSWHGSHVTGTIVANGFSSGYTILGGGYGAKVVPVRVLGSAGGYTSDIANGILWAVNYYPGITNSNPAQVISMSLGGIGGCDQTFQDAINIAINTGSIVVVAAGNATPNGSSYTIYNVADVTPANCQNVISVSAKGWDNKLSWYSSYGNTTITASAGNYPVTLESASMTLSNVWSSPKGYSYSNGPTYEYMEGTSQATPHVTSAIADIISYFNLNNISYNLSMITSILQQSAANLTNNSNIGYISDQGGSVSNRTLDVESALIYAVTYYGNNTLAKSPSSWSVTGFNTQTFTFINENLVPQNIDQVQVMPTPGITLSSPSGTCTTITSLAPESSCQVTLALTSYGVGSATLSVVGGSIGNIIAAVPITINNPQPSAPSGGGGGGGCSVAITSSDYSLILFLSSLSIFYFFRRKHLLK